MSETIFPGDLCLLLASCVIQSPAGNWIKNYIGDDVYIMGYDLGDINWLICRTKDNREFKAHRSVLKKLPGGSRYDRGHWEIIKTLGWVPLEHKIQERLRKQNRAW